MAIKTNTKINNKDYYRVTLDLGRDSNGKRVRKQFYGKTKKEAEQKKLDYLNKTSIGIVDNKMYLGKAMHDWLFEVVKVGQIKPSSFDKYEGMYRNYFKDSPLSILRIDKLQSIEIQRYYNKLFKEGKSSNVINNANKLLKQFLSYCQDNNYIINNPASGKKIIIPKDHNKVSNKEIKVFSTNDIKKIFNSKEDTIIKYISLISYATGMRRGEILGLSCDDIDFKEMEINIKKAVVTASVVGDDEVRSKKTYLSDTKTYKSARTIPLPSLLVPILKRCIVLKKEMVLKGVNIKKEYSNLIFLSEQGNLINASNFDKSFKSFLKRCNVDYIKFHALRHTYATRQFENGTPVLTVSKLLGHTKIDITLNTYTHVLKKEKEKAFDTLSLINL